MNEESRTKQYPKWEEDLAEDRTKRLIAEDICKVDNPQAPSTEIVGETVPDLQLIADFVEKNDYHTSYTPVKNGEVAPSTEQPKKAWERGFDMRWANGCGAERFKVFIRTLLASQHDEFQKTLNSGRKMYAQGKRDTLAELKQKVKKLPSVYRTGRIPNEKFSVDLDEVLSLFSE